MRKSDLEGGYLFLSYKDESYVRRWGEKGREMTTMPRILCDHPWLPSAHILGYQELNVDYFLPFAFQKRARWLGLDPYIPARQCQAPEYLRRVHQLRRARFAAFNIRTS